MVLTLNMHKNVKRNGKNGLQYFLFFKKTKYVFRIRFFYEYYGKAQVKKEIKFFYRFRVWHHKNFFQILNILSNFWNFWMIINSKKQ